MSGEDSKKIGDFCWVELCTPDIDSAKSFYQAILDWQFDVIPMPTGDYMMLKVGDVAIAGAYQLTPELKSQGAVPSWGSYVWVKSVDETTDRAKELGATLLKEPSDVSDMGRMSILADPTGAVFCLWQPRREPGPSAPRYAEGNLGWNELVTTDIKKAGEFYSALFGWREEVQEQPEKIYITFFNEDKPVGGLLELTEEMQGVPPHWQVYFNVDDLDKTLGKAEGLSAKVLYEPINHPDVGRFTKILDPQGVAFSVIQFKR